MSRVAGCLMALTISVSLQAVVQSQAGPPPTPPPPPSSGSAGFFVSSQADPGGALTMQVALPDGTRTTVNAPPGTNPQEFLRDYMSQQGFPAAAGARVPLRVGTGRLTGRVTTSAGLPLRQASVRASAPELNGSKATLTDQDGRYELRDLPAGRYSINASKPNYLPLSYGQTRPGGISKTVQLANGQSAERIDLSLPRGGVIAGRVVDEYGEPVTDAQVVPLQRRFTQGQMRLMNSGRTAMTNDIGEFRIYGLPPGQYYVSSTLRVTQPAPSDNDVRVGYAPTFYPGTPLAASAYAIPVGLSETVTGIEVALIATRLASVSGTALDRNGAPLLRGSVSATDRNGTTSSTSGTSIRPDGTFTLPALPPGDYLLRATAPPQPVMAAAPGSPIVDKLTQVAVNVERTSPPDVLIATVSVNGSDISGVVLTPIKKVAVSGRVIFDAPPDRSITGQSVRINTLPGSPEAAFGLGGATNAQVQPDFSFDFTVPAAELVLRASILNQTWVLKAIRIGGVDITDTGVDLRGGRDINNLEVEFTNRPQEIGGLVTNARGEPLPQSSVLLFPQDRERWILDSRLVGIARTDATGRYRIRTLPPGRYLAVALDPSQTANVSDPDVLESLRSRATPVSVAESEVKALDLRLSEGP